MKSAMGPKVVGVAEVHRVRSVTASNCSIRETCGIVVSTRQLGFRVSGVTRQYTSSPMKNGS